MSNLKRHSVVVLVAVAVWLASPAGVLSASQNSGGTQDWISVPIEVRGLPAGAEGVPVSTFVSFSQILQDANTPGVADTRSLRLFQLSSTGDTSEVPVQFSPAPQPRLKAQPLLPGTPLHLKYRLCLHQNDTVRGGIAQRYAQYEAKPQVHIGPASIKK